MATSAKPVSVQDILPWRDAYRLEMGCQIIHDLLHSRPGWTIPYLLEIDGVVSGYASLAVAGPWKGKPTVFEFYVLPQYRTRAFELFDVLLSACGAVAIETQTNGTLLGIMVHAYAHNITSEKILFRDHLTTLLPSNGAVFRPFTPADLAGTAEGDNRPEGEWLLELDGVIAATGGILWHYNRPYGDIYMEVREPYRRRGLGSYLVQELKRVCYEKAGVPAARCNPDNIPSRQTLQKAGFVPCGHILCGSLRVTG